ncbi:MAG: metalloprotease TldD [Candidatus Fonsibacter ubiquis]|nr:metalloprotease TldD [Candidatus Fonsibacter ubiquis]
MHSNLNEFFSKENSISRKSAETIVNNTLFKCDDGELFLESTVSESLLLDDGKIKNTSYDSSKGYGLRSVNNDVTTYSHSNELTEESLKQSAKIIIDANKNYSGKINLGPKKNNKYLYTDVNPIEAKNFSEKIELLNKIDKYLRNKSPYVKQVSSSIFSEYQQIEIIRPDNQSYSDKRPLVRFNVSVVALESIAAPAGEMKVVLGPGWPGILLHEAIGHGLEGDFNRKKTSAFSNLMGQKIADEQVTVVDDGTIENRRGSITIDDEGTPTNKTVLIEKGILKNYIQDRLNARLMNVQPTGNGRRESFEHMPMPRMTNTYMLSGKYHPDEIIKSVDNGIYAVAFGGGQVDITNGKFVFSCTEAYEIKNGKIQRPLKGATLIGNGPDVLTKVKMVGNDMELDAGVGTCGKNGQWVPVGVGQPTILIDGITVGGTQN